MISNSSLEQPFRAHAVHRCGLSFQCPGSSKICVWSYTDDLVAIYSVNPCISMHEQSRAEYSGSEHSVTETNSDPGTAALNALAAPKRARTVFLSALVEAEPARATILRALAPPEQARAAFSSAPAAPGQAGAVISSALAAPKQARTALSSALAAAEQAPAAISSAKVAPVR